MKHPFFKGLNWEDVYNKKLPTPKLEDIEDFDDDEDDELQLQVRFTDKDYEFRNRKMNRVIKFTFIKENDPSINSKINISS